VGREEAIGERARLRSLAARAEHVDALGRCILTEHTGGKQAIVLVE
jgi:hypothetical protein